MLGRLAAVSRQIVRKYSNSMDSIPENLKCKMCIIGSGPAAHTAAIYAARAHLDPVLLEGFMANGIAAGGQLTTTTIIENFPGWPEGIDGNELVLKFRQQSENLGTKIYSNNCTSIDISKRPFKVFSDSSTISCETLIVATGAVARRLGVKGEDVYWNRGISACAVCDGAAPIFRKKTLAVVGGGDTAMEEALFLTHFASEVCIIHRRDVLRASRVMQQRARSNDKIKFIYFKEVVEALGDGKLLKELELEDTQTKEKSKLQVAGLFYAIGHIPATEFLNNQLTMDKEGYVLTKPGTTQTSVEGVFACGDVQDKVWRQAITAAGTGCMAALEADRYLSELTIETGGS